MTGLCVVQPGRWSWLACTTVEGPTAAERSSDLTPNWLGSG